MYNHGLVKFLQYKKLKLKECINAFLKSEGVTEFSSKHHNRVNNYIQKNWEKFCSFVDKGIKDGSLHGKAVKLNTHFDERRKYQKAVQKELEDINLTQEQKAFMAKIRKDGIGWLQSIMMKKGINSLPKNLDYKAKSLQWLPIINQAIKNGITI